jgi:uncharacterized protein HemY
MELAMADEDSAWGKERRARRKAGFRVELSEADKARNRELADGLRAWWMALPDDRKRDVARRIATLAEGRGTSASPSHAPPETVG